MRGATSDDATSWRLASWRTQQDYLTDELPEGGVVPFGRLVEAAHWIPEAHHAWMINHGRLHTARLRQSARILVGSGDHRASERLVEIVKRALEETADVEQLRSSVLSASRFKGEPDRARAEIAALMQIVSEDAHHGIASELLQVEVDQMTGRLEELLRDHAYLRSSKSWVLTSPLRFAREQWQNLRPGSLA